MLPKVDYVSHNSSFCYGDEENGHRACTSEHLTTANQSETRKAYLVSVKKLDADKCECVWEVESFGNR